MWMFVDVVVGVWLIGRVIMLKVADERNA
jgi:hypothetical protein